MRVMTGLTERVANHLGLTVQFRFGGGEFGATLVRRHNSDFVLKVFDLPGWLPVVTQGTDIANRLRSTGYPAPEYVGAGTFEESTWTLQRVLPGRVPGEMTTAHAEALLGLAERHAGFAEEAFDWQSAALRQTRRSLDIARSVAPELVAELEQAVERADGIELRRGDVVHSDFHHRNFLAEGDRVTGVFDWEIASPGDWRFDVVALAFWLSMVPASASEEARRLVRSKAESLRDPGTLAFMAAALAARQLDFYIRRRPERVPGFQAALERTVAPWWRHTL